MTDNRRKNPLYNSGRKRLRLSSYCIFLDILGFTKQMESSYSVGEEEELFRKLIKAINSAADYLKIDAFDSNYQFFSDCVVIGLPLTWGREHGESEFATSMQAMCNYQLSMVLSGFFSRGGLSFGDLHMGKNIVFGSSYLEAYLTEKKASYPRIILSASAILKLEEQLRFYSSISKSPHNSGLLVGEDGSIFVNYLNALIPSYDVVLWDCLESHQKAIIENLERFKNETGIYPKYRWLAEYHNFYCKTFVLPEMISVEEQYSPQLRAFEEIESELSPYLINISETPQHLFRRLSEVYFKHNGDLHLYETQSASSA